MLKILDLKKMAEQKEVIASEKKAEVINSRKMEDSEQKKGLSFLDFNIKAIKSRYIFPFNENFVRKNNYKMRDLSNLIEKDKD